MFFIIARIPHLVKTILMMGDCSPHACLAQHVKRTRIKLLFLL